MGEAIKGFFGDWFSLNGFNIWKLNTAWDYVFFIAIVAAGVFLIWLAIRFLAKRRTPEYAARRVEKRLLRLGGHGSKVYRNVTFQAKKDTVRFGMLWAAKDHIYIVKVYHFGLDVSGSADSSEWRLAFNKDVRRTPNPLPELREQAVVLNRLFQRQGVRGCSAEPLVVFADNYGTARLALKGVDCAVVYQRMKKWRKDHPLPKDPPYDLAAAERALEACFVQGKALPGRS